MPLCVRCLQQPAIVEEPKNKTEVPKVKRGRGRPKTVVNFKEAKKKYNADYYKRVKERKKPECVLDNINETQQEEQT